MLYFFIAAEVIFALLGLICIFAPKLMLRAEQRDDPQAASKIRKAGVAVLAFAIFAALRINSRMRFFL